MVRHRNFLMASSLLVAGSLSGCVTGPPANGTFERTFDVSGPIRLELSNVAGDVNINGSSDGKVHIHADVRASGFGFDSPRKRVDEILASPPLEQRGDTIRVGKDLGHVRNVAISYEIEVPHDAEIDTSIVSGAETLRRLRGPVKTSSVSGSILVENVERDAQLHSVSGSVDSSNVGGDVRAGSVSGALTIANTKGDVRANAISGVIRIDKLGGRVDARSTSGVIEVNGAMNDVKASAVSGRVNVSGKPANNSYWDLHTTSGSVQIAVPANSNFHLAAEATSGEIRTGIPIMIEEQTKHSLRARVGEGGARIQIRTVSGQIEISPLR